MIGESPGGTRGLGSRGGCCSRRSEGGTAP